MRRTADVGCLFASGLQTLILNVNPWVPGMKIKIVVHDAAEGGFWAEVPAIPGCATQGDTMEELMANLHEAIEGCLGVDVATPRPGGEERILEIAL